MGDRAEDHLRPTLFERLVDRIPFLAKELFLLRRLVRPGHVCLDVGAAGGAHLLVMAYGAGTAGLVVGVEPRPGSHRMLVRLVGLLRLKDRVRLVQAALADRAGAEPLRIPMVVPTRAHFRGSAADADGHAAFVGLPHRTVTVPTLTLDDLVDRLGLTRVDVLKCDVEGAELLVFAGAGRVLAQHRPIVIVEADDLHQRRYEATADDVIAAVRAHDYLAFRYRRGVLSAVPGAVPDEDDYVLVPAERVHLAQR